MFSFDSKGFARAAAFIWIAAAAIGASGYANATGLSRVNVGAPAPSFTAPGADGKAHSLRDYAGKLVVLEWTSPVCPFTAVKYKSGAMQTLQRYAAERQIVWISIDTAAPDKAGYLTAAAARARIAQTHATVTAFLFDASGKIARSYGAKTTPSFFVIDRNGKLAYQGAMDDQVFADQGEGRAYMKSALDDLVAGRPLHYPETQPQGCAIEY
ncbi:MAG TPA: redoxin domain-containing protein [Steroidobacteraceae bacterium]|nr:redoxin domain-containing protein [Steroidobacteraceae bacterium]